MALVKLVFNFKSLKTLTLKSPKIKEKSNPKLSGKGLTQICQKITQFRDHAGFRIRIFRKIAQPPFGIHRTNGIRGATFHSGTQPHVICCECHARAHTFFTIPTYRSQATTPFDHLDFLTGSRDLLTIFSDCS